MDEDQKPKRRKFPKTPQELADAGLNWYVVVDGKRKPATKEEAFEYCIQAMQKAGADAPRSQKEFRRKHGGKWKYPYLVSNNLYFTEDLFPTREDFVAVMNLFLNYVALDPALQGRLATALLAQRREIDGQAAQGTQAVEATKENIMTLNTTLFYGAKVAIATSGFQNPTAEEKWPHAPIKRQRVKALAIMRPTDKDLQDPEEFLEESALRLWQEKMTAEVKKMNDETADILDGVISIYLDKAKDPSDGVWVKAKELLRMRGIRPHPKRGFKTDDKKRVAMSIHRLARVFIRVYEAEWEGIVERDGKERKVHRTGKVDWNDGKRFIEAEILHVEGRAGVELLWGEVEYDAWCISLGKQLAPFILGPGKQMALLSRKTLEFDPMRQKYEKRLTRYLSWIWRIRAAAGDLLQPFKMRTLCEEIKLEDMKRKPGVRTARMEKALDALQDAGIIASWQYEDGYEPTGNFTKWLDTLVFIEPAEIHKTQAEKIERPEGKPKAKAPIAPQEFDPGKLRETRLNRNLTQLQAAEELQDLIAKGRVKASLSRPLYALIESGKRKPTNTMKKILADWMGGNV